jgi:DNA-binding beta-propeller fold protein YncE
VIDPIPAFKVDPYWPEPLPNNWLIGQVSGIAIDSKDHIWVIHRPKSLGSDESMPNLLPPHLPYSPAPSIMEFDSGGKLIQAWSDLDKDLNWPESEHGIFIDHEDNVWIGGFTDHRVLKFRPDGKLLLQIGKSGKTGGSNDTTLLGGPTDVDVDRETNEVYIADGYVNHRIIVFDATTGKYKRHWGAYGRKPDDADPGPYDREKVTSPLQFSNPVHAVRISNDGLVYVCDRRNNRIQVFQKDGKFIREVFICKETSGAGTAWDLDFSRSPGQELIFVADGTNQCVWILHRENLQVMGHFGRIGRYAGQFMWIHNVAVDSKGNIYTAEVHTGKRIQKFNHAGHTEPLQNIKPVR